MENKRPRFLIEFCWNGRLIEKGTVNAPDALGALTRVLHWSRPDIADEVCIQDDNGQELLRRRLQPVCPVGELQP